MKVESIEKFDELYYRFTERSAPQPGHVVLDPENSVLWVQCDLTAGPGGRAPLEAMGGQRRRYPLWEEAPPTGRAANALLEQLAPLATRMVAGWRVERRQGIRVGVLDEDAERAEEELEEEVSRISSSWQEEDLVASLEAGQWFESSPPEVKTTSSDEELVALRDQFEGEALEKGIILEGVLRFLQELRKELRQNDEDYDDADDEDE